MWYTLAVEHLMNNNFERVVAVATCIRLLNAVVFEGVTTNATSRKTGTSQQLFKELPLDNTYLRQILVLAWASGVECRN